MTITCLHVQCYESNTIPWHLVYFTAYSKNATSLSATNTGASGRQASQRNGVQHHTRLSKRSSQITIKLNLILLDSAPTMGELLCLSTSSGEVPVNLAELIGTEYFRVGILLLNDTTGRKIDALEKELRYDATNINRRVFQSWLIGAGKQPVTWATLIAVLRDVGLNMIVETIESALITS